VQWRVKEVGNRFFKSFPCLSVTRRTDASLLGAGQPNYLLFFKRYPFPLMFSTFFMLAKAVQTESTKCLLVVR